MSPSSGSISEFSVNTASVTNRFFNPENPKYHQHPGNIRTWEQWVGWSEQHCSQAKGRHGLNMGSVEEERPAVLSLVIDEHGGQKSRRRVEVVIRDQEGNNTLCKAMRLSLG